MQKIPLNPGQPIGGAAAEPGFGQVGQKQGLGQDRRNSELSRSGGILRPREVEQKNALFQGNRRGVVPAVQEDQIGLRRCRLLADTLPRRPHAERKERIRQRVKRQPARGIDVDAAVETSSTSSVRHALLDPLRLGSCPRLPQI
jgi:hypothetical protein